MTPTLLSTRRDPLGRIGVFVLALISVSWASRAHAYPRDVPLEVLCLRSDAILVGKVVGQGELIRPPTDMDNAITSLDGEWPDRINWFRWYRIRIAKVIKESAARGAPVGAVASRPSSDEVNVLARSRRQGDETLGWLDDLLGSGVPGLTLGESYCLVLHRMPGERRYYLRGEDRCHRRSDATWVAAVEKAAELDRWPWGTPVRGLRLAILPSSMPERSMHPADCPRLLIAIGNISDRPIKLNLHPHDQYLVLRATAEHGETVEQGLGEARAVVPRQFTPRSVGGLAPGEINFLTISGIGYVDVPLRMNLQRQAWWLQAVYQSYRYQEGLGLWTGSVKSQPICWNSPGRSEDSGPRQQTSSSAPATPDLSPGRPKPASDGQAKTGQ